MAQQCDKLSAVAFFRAVCGGDVPPQLIKLSESLGTQIGTDLFCLANAIGAMEPLGFTRPGAGEIKQIFDKTITVPPATFEADGVTVKPTDGKLIKICAPEGKILVVDKLRGLPVNLTAVEGGTIVMKRMAVMGFSEGFCPAGEPADGDDLGTFQNMEHVLLPPGGGFDLYGRNFNPYSPAMFSVHGEMWATC